MTEPGRAARRTRLVPARAILLAACLALWSGCTNDDQREAARHAELTAAGRAAEAADLFHVEVRFFHRAAGARWRPAEDLEFPIRDESHVRAEATLHNLRPRRVYTVHLVWIRPDGRELFRRHAEVTDREIVYRKAMDLQFAQRQAVEAGADAVTLESRLNISRERERAPGTYRLRIYLDRHLLHEIPFTVRDGAAAG